MDTGVTTTSLSLSVSDGCACALPTSPVAAIAATATAISFFGNTLGIIMESLVLSPLIVHRDFPGRLFGSSSFRNDRVVGVDQGKAALIRESREARV